MRALLAILLASNTLAGCTPAFATLPEGRHGELVDVRNGWLTAAQLSNNCTWEQREYAARIRCVL